MDGVKRRQPAQARRSSVTQGALGLPLVSTAALPRARRQKEMRRRGPLGGMAPAGIINQFKITLYWLIARVAGRHSPRSFPPVMISNNC